MQLDAKVPGGPMAEKWTQFKEHQRLINPANKSKYHVIVVGSGLAGGAAAATLAELGYKVSCFCFQDSPRRAHSIAAQGGINAAKNYRNDGDSVHRLFYDTVKGGDFRSREANVHRLAEVSVNIIDQCVAQGVPFAREYGGLLDTRSFGGAQLQRTFYCRGQTGQQLLLGAYQALSRQIALGGVQMYPRCEMLDLVVIDGKARGIVTRHLETGAGRVAHGRRGGARHRRLRQRLLPQHERHRVQRLGHLPRVQARRRVREPVLHADPPDVHPGRRRPPVEAHADEREPAQRRPGVGAEGQGGLRQKPEGHPRRATATTTWSASTPRYGNLAPRDIASRAAKEACDDGRGVGPGGRGVYLDFGAAIAKQGKDKIEAKYGNLFEMYERITAESGYERPMRIYPAVHYTMGGLWVNYELMSNVPGLFCVGEANFSDHGANRLGASALMQGLADGYFVLPYTLTHWLAGEKPGATPTDPRGVQADRGGGDGEDQEVARGEGQEDGDRVPPRTGQRDVGEGRHGPHEGEPGSRHRADQGVAGGVLGERERCRGPTRT